MATRILKYERFLRGYCVGHDDFEASVSKGENNEEICATRVFRHPFQSFVRSAVADLSRVDFLAVDVKAEVPLFVEPHKVHSQIIIEECI